MKKLVNDKDIKTASIIINEEYLTNIVAFHCLQALGRISPQCLLLYLTLRAGKKKIIELRE